MRFLQLRSEALDCLAICERKLRAICFGVAQEHHAAIVTLLALKQPLSASAFALARPLFEAYVRGMWITYCADDKEIEAFHAGKVPDTASLIDAIDRLHGEEDSNLRHLYKRSWRAVSGMTHAGGEHHARWSDGEVLEPAYTEDDVGALIDFAARIGVLATAGIAQLSKDPESWKRILIETEPLMPPRFDAPASQ